MWQLFRVCAPYKWAESSEVRMRQPVGPEREENAPSFERGPTLRKGSSGRLMRQNLPLLGRDEAWVQEILKNYNCRVQDVYLLTSEPDGKLYFAAMREDEA